MTGFCLLRSHTTVLPFASVEATMCCTLRFHAMKVISVPGAARASAPPA